MEAILLPTTSAIIKVLRHFKLGLLEAKRNNLAGISARNATLKGTSHSQTSVMVQRDISPNDNLKNLAREKPYNWPQKRKNNIGNSRIIDFIKGDSSDLDQITI